MYLSLLDLTLKKPILSSIVSKYWRVPKIKLNTYARFLHLIRLSHFPEKGTIQNYASAFDQNPSQLVPDDMNVLATTNKAIVGAYIKRSYVGNASFYNNIKNCISVSSLNCLKYLALQWSIPVIQYFL